MFIVSTALRNHLLATGALDDGLNGGVIRMYTGTIPTSADASLGTAVLKCTISLNKTGAGINFEAAPVSGVLAKSSSETWLGEVVAAGDYSFYRFSSLTDDGSESTTEKRLQGTIGVLNADLLVGDIALAVGQEQRVDSYYVGMPVSA